MNTTWPLSDAGVRFAELVREARAHGPQTVTDSGERVVVVLSVDEFDRLHGFDRLPGQRRSLLAALQACPARGLVDLGELRSSEDIRSLDIPLVP